MAARIRIPLGAILGLLVALVAALPNGIDRLEGKRLGEQALDLGLDVLRQVSPLPLGLGTETFRVGTLLAAGPVKLGISVGDITQLLSQFLRALPGGISREEAEQLGWALYHLGVRILAQIVPAHIDVPLVTAKPA